MRSNTRFAVDLYKELAVHDGNLLFAPHCISTALAMADGGARGVTAGQMAEVLHFTLEGERLHSAFAEIQEEK